MQCKLINGKNKENERVLTKFDCAVFSFIGENYHQIYIPKGVWKFELFGAASGKSYYESKSNDPGLGAYVSGVISLQNDVEWYGYVGGKGADNTPESGKGGYNGGVDGGDDPTNANCGAAGSGGATDIRIHSGDLYSRIIVAGGGGSPGCYYLGGNGGSGGDVYGCDGDPNSGKTAFGGEGGNFDNYTLFGIGQQGVNGDEAGGSGGGGYFGGSGGQSQNVACSGGGGGGGGSSYVSGCASCKTFGYDQQLHGNIHSSNYYFQNIVMTPGNESFTKIMNLNIGYVPHKEDGLIIITKMYVIVQTCLNSNSFIQLFNLFISHILLMPSL